MNVKELLNLKGKVCLVTGGAGKYGRCILEGLAEAGATVVTASRNLESGKELSKEMQEKGLDVHALRLDQAEHSSIVETKKNLQEKFGGLDVLVNNAVARPCSGFNCSMDELTKSFRINAVGVLDLTREMVELLEKSKNSAIINIASMMGMFGPDLSNYEGTDMGDPAPDYFFHRAGMINYTKYLARYLADKGIRANCISPGGLFANQNPIFLKNYNSKVPVGRMANNDDIKGLVVLLASDASAYINGENILMDGGMHS
jgi:NAD(P)-dependent dehydrogenase (short-subunit alcohol dehydrogenase family)